MNKKRINISLLCLCFMLVTLVAYGQGPTPTPPPPPGNELPIDGGLSLLLVSGVAYGIYELRRKK